MKNRTINRSFQLVVLCLFVFTILGLSSDFARAEQSQYLSSISNQPVDRSFYSVQRYSAIMPELQRLISVEVQEQAISEVLEIIAQKADLGIAYNAELQSLKQLITLQLASVSVAEALQMVLKATPFEAALSRTREIVLMQRKAPPLKTVQTTLQQEISGTVTDAETGEPMPGVNVVVEETTIGTATDSEGHYSLSVPDEADSLTFSFIGYETELVPINGRSVINVQLVPQMQTFDEVVITALGITRQERSIGYSTQQVEGENLTYSKEMNVLGSLAGKIAGVQVQGSSGASMGGTSNIQIRGVSSLSGSGEGKPLIVVDGTPISNANFSGRVGTDYGNLAQDINPEAVKSVQVLKGPAATALYGIRGKNGVIIYTTKDGSGAEEFTVEINTGFSLQKTASFMEMQNKYGGGYQQEWKRLANGQPYVQVNADESWGPKMDGTLVREFFSFYPQDPMYGKLTPFSPQPNNLQEFYETGLTLDQGVTLSGGGKSYNFRLSLNNTNINGVYPNAKLNRTNLGLAASVDVGERWTFSTDLSYATNDARRPQQGSQVGRGYFRQWFQRQLDMSRLKDYQYPDGTILNWNMSSPDSATSQLNNRSALYWPNPYFSAYKSTTHDYRDRIFGNVGVTFDAFPGLSISSYIRGDMYIQNIEGKTAAGGVSLASYSFDKYQNVEMNYELVAKYTRDWEEFSLDATVGTNLFHRQYSELQQATVGGLITPGYYNIAASVDRPDVSSYKLEKKILSGYGLLSLGYQNTYFLALSIRGDKTSTLPEDNNTYWYPSISGSFVFSELIDWEALSFGKLRLSYAQAGSDLDPYQTTKTYAVGDVYAGTKTLFVPNSINNPNIKPTISTAYEAGFDLNFWNRLGIHATYYHQESKNQIITLNVSGTSGYRSAVINAGLIENQGIELSITGTPIQQSDFSWNTAFNVSKNVNEVVRLHPDIDVYTHEVSYYSGVPTFLNSYEGKAFGVLVGIGFQRDPETGKKLIGEDGLPLYTPQADEQFGSVLPDFVGGFQNNFRYKNFTLSTMISFQVGGQFFSRSLLLARKTGLAPETAAINDKGNNVRDPVSEGGGVKVSGISAETGQPVTNYVDAHALYNDILGEYIYEPWVVDASFVKLDEVSLGYTFDQSIIKKLPVKNVGVSLYVRNPIMIWQEAPKGINPSIFSSGSQPIPWYESSQLPTVRSFGFNLNIIF